tara:strand:- start:512 stop:673 length:162 start_codon:yes stop_codon:yes gene_type:complete
MVFANFSDKYKSTIITSEFSEERMRTIGNIIWLLCGGLVMGLLCSYFVNQRSV